MISELAQIDSITGQVIRQCIEFYVHYVSSSKASWNALLCLNHVRTLNFRARFASQSLIFTKDKVFAFQNMKELAITSHGFILNCTIAALTYSDTPLPKNTTCNKQDVVKSSQALQAKLFLQPSQTEFLQFKNLLSNFIGNCIPNENKETTSIITKVFLNCSYTVSYTHPSPRDS
eukprot:TRINITY_DN18502_c0_g1_i2.p1 TRINITY_DN18502_c0_g1~~TRINITY_DN18502_c0_g1_i2.p1  ORF type:complete len:175 (-),score=4.48 TRINITY_DN18502_c0_g1_i2:37-561(-)